MSLFNKPLKGWTKEKIKEFVKYTVKNGGNAGQILSIDNAGNLKWITGQGGEIGDFGDIIDIEQNESGTIISYENGATINIGIIGGDDIVVDVSEGGNTIEIHLDQDIIDKINNGLQFPEDIEDLSICVVDENNEQQFLKLGTGLSIENDTLNVDVPETTHKYLHTITSSFTEYGGSIKLQCITNSATPITRNTWSSNYNNMYIIGEGNITFSPTEEINVSYVIIRPTSNPDEWWVYQRVNLGDWMFFKNVASPTISDTVVEL